MSKKSVLFRLATLMLALTMLFCLTACGSGDDTSTPADSSDVSADVNEPGDDNAAESDVPEEDDNVQTGDKTTTTAKGKVTTTKGKVTTTTAKGKVEETIDRTKPWKQTQFFLSTLMGMSGGLTYDQYRKGAQYHKDAGITLMENAGVGRESTNLIAQACEEVGIRFMVQDINPDGGFSGVGGREPNNITEKLTQSVVDQYSDYKYLEAYHLWDEVLHEDFDLCLKLTSYFTKQDPARLAYTLLLPSYSTQYQWGGAGDKSYEKYVTDYVEKNDPAVLSFDYYPFYGADTTLYNNEMWRDMGLFRKLSLETGKPFWFYFQAWNMGRGFTMTDTMRSVQMYAALAYGAKTVSYYSTIDCLIDTQSNKREGYDSLKELNRKVNNMGNYLFNKKSEELLHFGIVKKNHDLYYLTKVEDSNLIADCEDNTIVSVFGDGSTKKYVMVVNKNYNSSKKGTLTLKTNKSVKFYDHNKNKTYKVSDSTKAVSFAIGAGDCALFIVE